MLTAVECLATRRVVSRNTRHQNLYGLTLTPNRRLGNAGRSAFCAVSRLGNLPRPGTSGGGVGFCPPPVQSACRNIDRFWDYLNADAALARRELINAPWTGLPESALVKGFGCRPEHERSNKAGVRKPPRKEPAGRRVGGCRLWGFDGAAGWVGDAFAGVVGGSDDRGSEFAAAAAVGWAIFGLVDDAAGALAGTEATARQRRKRGCGAGEGGVRR
jgi:hypothetical protein